MVTLKNWIAEFEKWAPDVEVVLLHGVAGERAVVSASLLVECEKVVVMSYETTLDSKSFFEKSRFEVRRHQAPRPGRGS